MECDEDPVAKQMNTFFVDSSWFGKFVIIKKYSKQIEQTKKRCVSFGMEQNEIKQHS